MNITNRVPVNNSCLLSLVHRAITVTRDEQLSSKCRREIIVLGLGLLLEQNLVADRPISFGRSSRIFYFPARTP
jgi:hypothetical protein